MKRLNIGLIMTAIEDGLTLIQKVFMKGYIAGANVLKKIVKKVYY